MPETVASPLQAWDNFYVIVGSSAAALTGLQFVVLTLIAESGPVRGRKESIAAFGSPNVVHFCAGLLVASILSAPWAHLQRAGIAVAGCGVLGVGYSIVVLRRALRQQGYRPVMEDWVWHTILPTIAYSSLLVAGAVLDRAPGDALFVIGATLLLLVFIGIHNAWDTVTYVTVIRAVNDVEGDPEPSPARVPAGNTSPAASVGVGNVPSESPTLPPRTSG